MASWTGHAGERRSGCAREILFARGTSWLLLLLAVASCHAVPFHACAGEGGEVQRGHQTPWKPLEQGKDLHRRPSVALQAWEVHHLGPNRLGMHLRLDSCVDQRAPLANVHVGAAAAGRTGSASSSVRRGTTDACQHTRRLRVARGAVQDMAESRRGVKRASVVEAGAKQQQAHEIGPPDGRHHRLGCPRLPRSHRPAKPRAIR